MKIKFIARYFARDIRNEHFKFLNLLSLVVISGDDDCLREIGVYRFIAQSILKCAYA